MIQVFVAYLIVINLIGIFIMKLDKSKAKNHQWRVKERSLFLVALLGGGMGCWWGMYLFRHKTKHWYFVVGMPLITFVEYGLLFYFVLSKLHELHSALG